MQIVEFSYFSPTQGEKLVFPAFKIASPLPHSPEAALTDALLPYVVLLWVCALRWRLLTPFVGHGVCEEGDNVF